MFRKRKTVSPSFRLPVPYNPIQGSDNALYGPMRLYARFVLREELTNSDESATADITTTHQWGPGLHHCPDVIVHVHNLLARDKEFSSGSSTPTASQAEQTYLFSGSVGDVGLALWDHNNHWRIIMLGGNQLIGFCLAEDHPGRGSSFNVYMGTWDSDDNEWVYDTSTELKAIDWRYGVPYPDAGATGLFTPRTSREYGVIWEVVALDCDSPGACNESATATATNTASWSIEEESPSVTLSNTPSSTPSATVSSTPSSTVSQTPSNTPSVSPTGSNTPSATVSNTPSQTVSQTPSNTPSNTVSSTPSATVSNTPSHTKSRTPSSTPSATVSNTPSQTPSRTQSQTPSATVSNTPSNTPSPSSTPSNTVSQTPSNTVSQTTSSTPSQTPSATVSQTPSRTPSATGVSACCCPNIEETPTSITATIDGDCYGTMDGAYGSLTCVTHYEGCCYWTGFISFQCYSGDNITLAIDMYCTGDQDACRDYYLEVKLSNTGGYLCCNTAYSTQGSYPRADESCICDPLNMTFGPFTLWQDTPPDPMCTNGCKCCQEFNVIITE